MSFNPFMQVQDSTGDQVAVTWPVDPAYANAGLTKTFQGTVIKDDQSWLTIRDKFDVILHIPISMLIDRVKIEINPPNPFITL